MTGFTRLVTFASLITVVAAVTAGGWEAGRGEQVVAASQVADGRA